MLLATIFQILELLLNVLWWVIIAQVVISWLVLFNVINTQSSFVRQFMLALDQITAPLYRPIRRILPDFGGLDFSPVVVLILIKILSAIVLPNLMLSLHGGGAAL